MNVLILTNFNTNQYLYFLSKWQTQPINMLGRRVLFQYKDRLSMDGIPVIEKNGLVTVLSL